MSLILEIYAQSYFRYLFIHSVISIKKLNINIEASITAIMENNMILEKVCKAYLYSQKLSNRKDIVVYRVRKVI